MRLGKIRRINNLKFGFMYGSTSMWGRKGRRGRKKSNLLLFIAFVLIITIYFATLFEKEVKPFIMSIAEVRARYIAIDATNYAVYDIISREDITYEKLVTLQKNNSGQITALQSNMLLINRLKTDIAIAVQERIASVDKTEIRIPFSNFINNNFFYDLGPKVPITLMAVGSAQTDFESAFSSAGINQTKHEISIVVKSRVRVILPIMYSNAEFTTKVPVAETIIVGMVPEQYLKID